MIYIRMIIVWTVCVCVCVGGGGGGGGGGCLYVIKSEHWTLKYKL